MKIDYFIEQIKKNIPEIIHYILFFQDGIVIKTSFTEENNIPELGKNAGEIIEKCQQFLLLTGIESKDYRKIVYEGIRWMLFILQVGEQSHLALIMQHPSKEVPLQPIRKYLELIENAIDISQEELEGSDSAKGNMSEIT